MNLVARASLAIRSVFATPQGILGCDVYFGSDKIFWEGAKIDGVVFAGIRWGQRDGHTEADGSSWTDPRVHENWEGAEKQKIDRFGYWVWDEREGHGAGEHFAGVLMVYSSYDGELPLRFPEVKNA